MKSHKQCESELKMKPTVSRNKHVYEFLSILKMVLCKVLGFRFQGITGGLQEVHEKLTL